MAEELTKIALAANLGKGVGSPQMNLFMAKRPGLNTPVKMVANPPIPPIGGPKLPSLAQTSPPGSLLRSNGSMPRTPNMPSMNVMKS